ncbi:trypsin-like serine protease [Catellatospora bangladeshensis]|uniref:Protease n=1 Tax=Catellatospora bangladeshensis TaxID=310355 RepID=A0A8J3JMF9_9ACTN|nr:trypsin-like serine protease [Catellatospora bangladeshensis]GIF79794.1 protease [Catellatospora bangladeshensis]
MSRNRRVIMSVIAATAVALSVGTLAAAGVIPAAWHEPAAEPAAEAAPAAGPPGALRGGAVQPLTGRSAAPVGPAKDPTTANPGALAAPHSVAFLRTQYGITEAEAVRRLALQQSAPALAQRLSASLPDAYAGLWLDQEAGGLLRVGMTRPDLLEPALAGVADAAHVRAVPATRSLKQLQATAAKLSADLAGRTDVEIAVDAPSNQVVVTAPAGADLTGISPAVTRAGGAARLHRSPRPAGVPKSCDPLNCLQPPLRSGIRLDVPRDNGTVGGCTTGYVLRSQKTGERFVLTAGHCVLNPATHSRIDDTWHRYLVEKMPVVVEHPDATLRAALGENIAGVSPYDYAIMPYADTRTANFWNGGQVQLRSAARSVSGGLINEWCPGGCPGGGTIPVTGVTPLANVLVGSVVCATGSGYTPAAGEKIIDSGAGAGYQPGTRCGTVVKKGVLISVKICARPGDSGGPLFTEADGKAVGILKYGDPGQGACTNADEWNHYAPVETILSRVNSRTDLQFELVTAGTATGPAPR